MITKLNYIKNCGRFSNFTAGENTKWNGEFGKINVIYGPNGMGKTTLAQILKSLDDEMNVPQLMTKCNNSPKNGIEISLCHNNNEYTFQKAKWTDSIDNILVYDSTYIRACQNWFEYSYLISISPKELIKDFRTKDELYESINDFTNRMALESDCASPTKPTKEEIEEIEATIKQLPSEIKNIFSVFTEKKREKELHGIAYYPSRNQEIINKYLEIFNTKFKISNISENNGALSFQIAVDEREMPPIKTGEAYNYLLSEGDKNSLALAFFFSILETPEVYPHLNQFIIVLDDPFTNFDYYRKVETIKLLAGISKKCKQFFLLSHDLNFIKGFYDNVNSEDKNAIKWLEILHKGRSNGIDILDTETKFMSDLRKIIKSLQDYLDKGANNEMEMRIIASNIRLAIEGVLKVKYYDIMSNKDMLGQFLDKKIQKSNNEKYPYLERLKDDILQQLQKLNNYSKQYHHSNPNYLNEEINPDQLELMVKKALDIIHYL